MTLAVFGLFFAYAYIRTKVLIFREELQMVKFEEDSYYDDSVKFNIKDQNHQIAFAVLKSDEGIFKEDANYVRWSVVATKNEDFRKTSRTIGFHKCTDDDYSNFFPVRTSEEKTRNLLWDS
jgi:hypothetical protein